MHSDPILREVHRMKDQSARQYNYDIAKMFEHFREEARKHPEQMVQPAPKTVSPPKRRTAARKTAK